MKKLLILFLCTIMVLSAFAGCTVSGGEETTHPEIPRSLSVGFGRADITPEDPVPLAGYQTSLDRMSDNVKDRLHASCIAFTDESDNTILYFSMETLYAYDVMLFGKADIAKETGIPISNIMVGTTHNHSCPDVTQVDVPAIEKYNKELRKKMVEAAVAALADRKPAKMYITTTYPENINYIRHYLMDDGTYFGSGFGSWEGKQIVKHVREVDNALQLIRFVREGAKDVIMMNWQGHLVGNSEEGNYYSILSYSERVTGTVEQELDCYCMYVLGASGDVTNSSYWSKEKIYKTYEERAAALADYIVKAEGYQEAAVGKVQILEQSCGCTPKGGGNMKVDLSLNAFSIGDVAFVTAPYEMFCENGEAIKAGSPFQMTFVSTCANRTASYIPSIATYEYNNMPDEVYEIQMSRYEPGTAEILQDAFVGMLKTLYETK